MSKNIDFKIKKNTKKIGEKLFNILKNSSKRIYDPLYN